MPWQIWQAEQVGDTDCLLSFLALSHKKNPRIFACKNRRILTQKRESEHVRILYLREPAIFSREPPNLQFIGFLFELFFMKN